MRKLKFVLTTTTTTRKRKKLFLLWLRWERSEKDGRWWSCLRLRSPTGLQLLQEGRRWVSNETKPRDEEEGGEGIWLQNTRTHLTRSSDTQKKVNKRWRRSVKDNSVCVRATNRQDQTNKGQQRDAVDINKSVFRTSKAHILPHAQIGDGSWWLRQRNGQTDLINSVVFRSTVAFTNWFLSGPVVKMVASGGGARRWARSKDRSSRGGRHEEQTGARSVKFWSQMAEALKPPRARKRWWGERGRRDATAVNLNARKNQSGRGC